MQPVVHCRLSDGHSFERILIFTNNEDLHPGCIFIVPIILTTLASCHRDKKSVNFLSRPITFYKGDAFVASDSAVTIIDTATLSITKNINIGDSGVTPCHHARKDDIMPVIDLIVLMGKAN
jgi:hypothetical protein